MKYASDHAGAYADIAEAGAPLTFTRETPGEYDEATGLWSEPTTESVRAVAIEIVPRRNQDSEAYRAATMNRTSHRLLLAAAATYGEIPGPGWGCVWGGKAYSVATLLGSTAPDGTAILFRPVLVA